MPDASGGNGRGLALYPGLLRFNQLTDTVGLQAYPYVLQEDLSRWPPHPKLPRLRFEHQEYWAQCAVGSIYKLHLRKGGLGFYQIDMAPIYQQVRAYDDRQE